MMSNKEWRRKDLSDEKGEKKTDDVIEGFFAISIIVVALQKKLDIITWEMKTLKNCPLSSRSYRVFQSFWLKECINDDLV
jgi:hypothetical protein